MPQQVPWNKAPPLIHELFTKIKKKMKKWQI